MVTRMNLLASSHGPATRYARKRISGFTLIEVLTVITIAAILMALGVPSYQYITNTNRISGEVNGLLGDMQYARSEAIKEGQNVTVCASNNATICSGSTAWQSGWIVFSDANADHAVNGNDVILRAQRAFPLNDTFSADNGTKWVTFNREGFAMNMPANKVTITLHAAVPNSSSTRCLQVTTVGQLTTELAGVQACL